MVAPLSFQNADIVVAAATLARRSMDGLVRGSSADVCFSQPTGCNATAVDYASRAESTQPTTSAGAPFQGLVPQASEDLQRLTNKRAIELLKSDAAFAIRLQTSEPVLVRDALASVSPGFDRAKMQRRVACGNESPTSIATTSLVSPTAEPLPPTNCSVSLRTHSASASPPEDASAVPPFGMLLKAANVNEAPRLGRS